ncbi:hypothetical protein ACE2AJ_19880 [Aquihabitans daechungensis]|uniref:hypothetical protein n=1 Tax=Aquihabitans daechungensis TaxID=1052257 RepID=UPI003B9F65B0
MPGAPPTTQSDTVTTACNNTFQPTRFALDYEIDSTVTSPVDGGGDAELIYPGDAFTVEFDATVNISATFLNGAYGIIGPQAVMITNNQVTIGALYGATGSNVVINNTTDVPIPQPGSLYDITYTSGDTTITTTGDFTGQEGANVYDSTGSFTAGATIASVTSPTEAELSLPATGSGTASGGDASRVWDFLTTDLPLSIGTGTGTFTATGPPTITPESPAKFTIVGNSTTTGDEALGISPLGFVGAVIDPSASATAVKTSLGPGINPWLVCMGGEWDETVDPGPPPTTTYGPGYTAPDPANGDGGFGDVEVTALPIPTATVSSVTQDSGAGMLPAQFVTSAARAGNSINFGGGNWTPSATVDSVELCDSSGASCDPAGLSGVSAAIDGTGVLSGTAVVTSTATTGAGRTLKVTAGSEEDHRATLLILGAPSLDLSSGSGPAGGVVNFTGSNWNPLSGGVSGSTFAAPVTLAGAPLAAPTPVVINATGGLSGSVTTPAGTQAVSVFDGNPAYPQPPGPSTAGSIYGVQLFSINQNAQNCGSGSPLTGCTLDQSLYLNVEPGDFTWSQDTPFIVLNSTTTGNGCAEPDQTTCIGMTLDGTTQTVTGSINEITVIDARGAGAPWDISATMTDLVTGAAGANEVLPASSMTLTPTCTVVDGALSGGTAAVTTGAAGPSTTPPRSASAVRRPVRPVAPSPWTAGSRWMFRRASTPGSTPAPSPSPPSRRWSTTLDRPRGSSTPGAVPHP